MKNSSSSNIFGVILIILGGLWFLSTTSIFHFDVWDYFWPAAFITVGVVLIVRGRALFLATLFIFFGGLNLASHMFNYSFDYLFDNYWPLLLIAAGLLILIRRKDNSIKDSNWKHEDWSYKGRRHRRRDDRAFGNPFYSNTSEQGPAVNAQQENVNNNQQDSNGSYTKEAQPGSDNFSSPFRTDFSFHSDSYNPLDLDRIDEVAILTSIRKFVTSQNFKGGRVTTILGGGIIDLSGAKLAEGDNILELTSIMGGVTFRVPNDWKVIVNVHSIFGGFEDKRRYFNQEEPKGTSTLIIKGTVIMGGGTVTY